MDYNGIISRIMEKGSTYQSKRFRVSLRSAYKFSDTEFEDYLVLAHRFGFVTRSGFQELEWVAGKDKRSYPIEDEVVRLTREGWEFIEKHDRPLLHRWGAKFVENVPTIVISALTALAVSWAVYEWGPTQDRPAATTPEQP